MASHLSKAHLKYLRSLHQKRVRTEEGLVLVEGRNVVAEAVATGAAREVYLTDEARAHMPDSIAADSIDDIQAQGLAQTRSPAGAFALVADPCAPLDPFALPERCKLLLAAGVSDPGNMGTLIRTAAALGFFAVVVTPGSVEPGNAKVVRATAGAIFRIPVLAGEASQLDGFAIWAADADGTPLPDMPPPPARCALAVGNEPRGLDSAVLGRAARRVSVPICGGVESLNVAVAAGILMHALSGSVNR